MTTTPVENLYHMTHHALSVLLEEALEIYRNFKRGHDYKDENALHAGVVDSIVTMTYDWAEGHGFKEHPLITEALAKIEAEREVRVWAEAHGYKDQPLITEAIIKFQAAQANKARAQLPGWGASSVKL